MKTKPTPSVLFLLLLIGTVSCSQIRHDGSARSAPSVDHTEWIAGCLTQIQTIQVGMTRQQLLNVFTMEGGLSNRRGRTYVCRECPYIKVDVQFKPVGNEDDIFDERPEDIIAKISRPYLQWSIVN